MASKGYYLVILSLIVLVVQANVLLPLNRRESLKLAVRDDGEVSERAEQVPVEGSIARWFEFWIPLKIGNPAREFNLLIDTGTTDTLVFSTNCRGTGCPIGVPVYNPASGTVVPCSQDQCLICVHDNAVCGFNQTFASGQGATGTVVRDEVTIGSLSMAEGTFGAIESVYNNFTLLGPLSGILGLAFKPLSEFNSDSIIGAIANASGIPDAFSICLTKSFPTMIVGIDLSTATGFEFTSINSSGDVREGFFSVSVTSILVGSNTTEGNETNIPPTELQEGPEITILDTGSTDIFLMQTAYNRFRTLLLATCDTDSPLRGVCTNDTENLFNNFCFSMTPSQIARFPMLSFTFEGISDPLLLPPEEYLYVITRAGQDFRCLAINTFPGLISNVFGQAFLQNFNVAFDRENMRIGFAPVSSCPTNTTAPGTTGEATTESGTSAGTTEVGTTGTAVDSTDHRDERNNAVTFQVVSAVVMATVYLVVVAIVVM